MTIKIPVTVGQEKIGEVSLDSLKELKDNPVVIAAAFLRSWLDRDEPAMAGLIWKSGQALGLGLSTVRVLLRMGLKGFEVGEESRTALSCTVNVKMKVALARDVSQEVSAKMRLVRESEEFTPDEKGEWGVVPETLYGGAR
jgi:hypothetical protein